MDKSNIFDKPMHVLVDSEVKKLPQCFNNDSMMQHILSISKNLCSCKTTGFEFRLLPFDCVIDFQAGFRDFNSLDFKDWDQLFESSYSQSVLQNHYCILSSILKTNNIIFEFDIASTQRLKPCFFLDFPEGLTAIQLSRSLKSARQYDEGTLHQSLCDLIAALDVLKRIEPSIRITSLGYMFRRYDQPVYRLNVYHKDISIIKKIANRLNCADFQNWNIIEPFPYPVLALDLISSEHIILSGIELKPNIRWSDMLKRAIYNQTLDQLRYQMIDAFFPDQLLDWFKRLPCSRLERRSDYPQYISHFKISISSGQFSSFKLYTRIDAY